MISRRKSYHFNKELLQFELKAVPLKIQLKKMFRVFGIASLIAVCMLLTLQAYYWTPFEAVLNSKIAFYKSSFLSLNTELDSLQNLLHSKYFYSDNYYRTVLGLDSMPTPVRFAGIGGAIPVLHFDAFPYADLINSTQTKSETLKGQIKIQKESYDTLFKEAVVYQRELTGIPAIQPVKPSNYISVSSGFGTRPDPFTSSSKTHEGVDFVGPVNTEVFATADGFVTLTDDSRTGYGKEIVLLHDFGFSTRYAHLNKLLVIPGQKITRGQLIGLMGSTGRSTGTHLHYEVRLNNRPLNPFGYFADNLSDTDYEQITKLNLSRK